MGPIFINKQEGGENKELLGGKDLQYYLGLTEGFESSFGEFHVSKHNGFNVIDESKSCSVGYKARCGEFFISKLKGEGVKELVYVQPRKGFAGISLSYLCKKYDMKLTLVMPSSKKVSEHQLLCIEYGAKPLFIRVVAMPNANRIAKMYSEKHGAYYVPPGLNHEYVVAYSVRVFYDYFKNREKPKNMWTVISTGVLTRSMQIALPETNFVSVGVSRNIQQGELGRAKFMGYHKTFLKKSDLIPETFECEHAYDSKGWDYMNRFGEKGDWFFSVAGNAPSPKTDPSGVDSWRQWNDLSDFNL